MPRKSAKILDGLEVNLRFLKEIGVEEFDVPAKKKTVYAPYAPQGGADGAAKPGAAKSTAEFAVKSAPADPSVLEELRRTILACRLCGLAQGRTQAVPGEGDPRAELMFVGEGPGRDEDAQGRPFVGRAGQLLTRIIAAMGFDRSRVFIANIVKCRPPDNRVPHRDEVESCTPHLLRQIELIRPRIIVSLGKTATDFFLPDTTGGMTSIRGRFYDWRGIRIMPTFHPSYLIRNEGNKEIKKMVWDDMKLVMALLAEK
ncbi:MAG: uracil-DNA glycosylase [Candidatus Aminicenantes bacterium]|nr:uracil-DNA glycosylase [Candidatus Aminicenantes bacterium]